MKEFGTADTAMIMAMIVAYIAFTSWLTLKLRSKTNAQFMVAGRALPAFVVAVLMMSEFIGAQSTVGTAQAAFSSGMGAAWSVLGASIGFLLFGLFFVKKLYGSGEFTISAAIAQKFGRSTMTVVSLIMIYALLLVNVGNYVSGAAALSTVLKVNLPVAACIIAVVSTFYYVLGGLKGVAYVTLLHSALKVFGVIAILSVALSMTGGVTPLVRSMPDVYFTWDGAIGAPTIFAWVIGSVGAIFSTQYIVQAISANRDAGHAQRSTFYASALCLPIGFALALVGVCAKFLFPNLNSLYALPVFIGQMNVVMAGLVTTALVASVFVSVSTVALAIASLIVRDFYKPYFNPEPELELRRTHQISILIGFAPLVFVLFIPSILKLAFFTRALRLSISVVALIGFYLPLFGTTRGATLGLIAAALTTTAWYLLNNPYGIDNMYIAAVTPLVIMAIERTLIGHGRPVMPTG